MRSEAKETGMRSIGRSVLVLMLSILGVAAVAPTAFAAPTPPVFSYGAQGVFGVPGSGISGELTNTNGHVAVDDATGNILVADPGHSRVSVFAPDLTPGGTAILVKEFAVHRAFGLAVDQSNGAAYVTDASNNERQVLVVQNATGGTFTLGFKGESTPPIAAGASPDAVQAALEEVSTIGAGNVAVNPSGSEYFITFKGALAETNVPQLTADAAGLQTDPPTVDVATAQAGVQDVTFANIGGGTFTLSFEGQTTSPIPLNANTELGGSNIQAALEALSTVGASNVGVSINNYSGPVYRVTFKGPLSETAVQMTADGTGLAEKTPSAVVTTADDGALGRIIRFLSDGAPIPTYTEDPTFTSPTKGAAAGQVADFSAPLAVDPSTHDLLVADRGNDRVSRYSNTGAFLGSFEGSATSAGKFTKILDIASDGTTTYVLDFIKSEYSSNCGCLKAQTRILRFGADGTYEGAMEGDSALSIGVDPIHHRVLATNVNQLLIYQDISPVLLVNLPNAGSAVALAADGGASQRAYVVSNDNFGGAGVSVLVPGPAVAADPVSSPEPREIHLTGTVNPGGAVVNLGGGSVTAHFEYCLKEPSCAYLPWISAPSTDISVGNGEADVAIETDLTELRPATEYLVRVSAVASDTGATVVSPVVTATTAATLPEVVTTAPNDLSTSAATLRGTINPLGVQATYYFEFGPTTAYGSRVPVDYGQIAGNRYKTLSVSHQITGLQPGTDYHYRLVGTNSVGSSPGNDVAFTTDAAGTPLRGYEMVSPVEKNGVPADSAGTGAVASVNGDAIMYGTEKSSYPGAESAGYISRVLGTRSASGWDAVLDLPYSNLDENNNFFFSTVAVSTDLTRELVISTKKLTPGATEDVTNLYLRELDTGHITFVATDPHLREVANSNGNYVQVGTSDDASKLVYIGGLTGAMYEASVGTGVRLVSELPNGTAALSGVSNILHDPHQVSADGSRIYFGAEGNLYLRENGEDTTLIHAGARFVAASPDGAFVMFQVGDTVYRYNVEAEAEETVASGVWGDVFLLGRAETGDLYYADLGGSIFHAQGGTMTQIAPGLETITSYQASPSGRYLAFESSAKLTGFDNHGRIEAYLYDSQTDALTCPSCRTDEGVPTGNASLEQGATVGSSFNRLFPRSVIDDGTVFFDTPDPLIGADANGTRDVYSSKDGRVRLLSRGKLPTTSTFLEASPDGSNVFFVTTDRLVGQDQDNVADLYDVRLGGGIASQNPPLHVECIRDDCKATPNAGPELPFGGSEAISGPGNVNPPRKRCGKGRHQVRKRCVVRKHHKRTNGNRRQAR